MFLATYLKSSRNKSQIGTSNSAVSSDAKNPDAKELQDDNDESLHVDAVTRISNDAKCSTVPRNPDEKALKRKRGLPIYSPMNDKADDFSSFDEACSETAETEEDKADMILSQMFLEGEKIRQEELAVAAENLKEEIDRHKIYLKHFFGPDSLTLSKSNLEKGIYF